MADELFREVVADCLCKHVVHLWRLGDQRGRLDFGKQPLMFLRKFLCGQAVHSLGRFVTLSLSDVLQALG